MSVGFIINPGSGDARAYGHTLLAHAWKAIRVFRREVAMDGVTIERHPDGRDEGRYGFILRRGGKRCEVWMPGLVLAQVRFRRGTTDNAWHFPRLLTGPYGSSWLWPFAVEDVREELTYAKERTSEPL